MFSCEGGAKLPAPQYKVGFLLLWEWYVVCASTVCSRKPRVSWATVKVTSLVLTPSEKRLEWHCVKLSKLKLFPCSQKRGNNFKHFQVLFINCRHLAPWHLGGRGNRWQMRGSSSSRTATSFFATYYAPPRQFFTTSVASLHPPSPYVSLPL